MKIKNSSACELLIKISLGVLAGAALVCAPAAAETYTLESYYPSPAGVYKTVTVTSTTVLARDGGDVSVGSALSPAASKTLSVLARFPTIKLASAGGNGYSEATLSLMPSARSWIGRSYMDPWLKLTSPGSLSLLMPQSSLQIGDGLFFRSSQHNGSTLFRITSPQDIPSPLAAASGRTFAMEAVNDGFEFRVNNWHTLRMSAGPAGVPVRLPQVLVSVPFLGPNAYPGYNSSYAFFVFGLSGGMSAWTNASDGKYKRDVATIENALDIVSRLRGVRFEWKDPAFGAGKKIGFIAQEVERVLPEVVSKEKSYSMETSQITAVLVEAVKEQQLEIAALQAQLRELREKADAGRK